MKPRLDDANARLNRTIVWVLPKSPSAFFRELPSSWMRVHSVVPSPKLWQDLQWKSSRKNDEAWIAYLNNSQHPLEPYWWTYEAICHDAMETRHDICSKQMQNQRKLSMNGRMQTTRTIAIPLGLGLANQSGLMVWTTASTVLQLLHLRCQVQLDPLKGQLRVDLAEAKRR